jgi:hypothetical protein
MKKIITHSNHARKCLFAKAFGHACRLVLQKKMLLTVILLTHVLIASFSQKPSVLLSTGDSCPVQPPKEQQTSFGIEAIGAGPIVRVAYVIPSNRTPQPNGVANLQHAIKTGQQFFKEQMEQNGFGAKTFVFETEADGVTPLIHVVHVAETDEYLRGDLWNRAQTAASNAGISLWADGEVWVVIPETHLMFPDGSGAGGVALGAGWGSGKGGGVSMIGSNALPLFDPAMITDDTPYDGKVLPELGPYPMKQDVTFAWFEGTTFSSVASSWLGALWHETGHAFGLGHDFRNDNNFHGNLMGNGLRGIRGSLFPEKYPQDYTRLEYWTALFLNVNHFFNSDKISTNSPTVSHSIPGSVTPQQGLVHLPFQASDPDGLSFAYVVLGGDMAAEMLLEGTTANPTFAIPYFRQGDINRYIIFTVDKQGNKTNTEVEFTVPGGNNQAPIPFIRIDPPVPGLNQSITLDASQSSDVDHDQSSLLASWDVDNDGQFDTSPSTNKTVQYNYQNPGNYLIRVKLTDPGGAQTISTPVSIKIPGERKIAVESFTLIDAEKDEAVSDLNGGLVIQQAEWLGKTFSVRANTSSGMTDRIEFNLTGPIAHEQIDNEPPYALFGDSPQGNFIGRALLPGKYVLTAVPFFGSEQGIALTVSFEVKGSPPGSIVKDKTIGGGFDDEFRSGISTQDGGYLFAGHSNLPASGVSRGGLDYWIVKTDAQYDQVWDKTFGGGSDEYVGSVISTHDGGYLLGGYSNSGISGDKTDANKGLGDYWVVKIDNQGNKVWDNSFGGDAEDQLFTMVSTPDGGYLLGGFSESGASGDKSENSKGSRDYWIVRIDNQGNKVWDKTIGGSGYDWLKHIIATTDGGWLLFGDSNSDASGDKSEDSKGNNDYWVVKIDNQGSKAWDKTIGGSGSDDLASAILTLDGGYLLAGYSNSDVSGDKSENGKGNRDYWAVKIDAAGNKVWDKTYGGSSDDTMASAISTSDGGYLLGGSSASNASGDKSDNVKGGPDYWVVKIDNKGSYVWDKTLGGYRSDNLSGIILTPNGGYLLTGSSDSDKSGDKSEDSIGGCFKDTGGGFYCTVDYWVIELEPATDQVCTGDVTLSSQAEVDAFNCTELTGNLTISGNDITNLDNLASLRKVSGVLRIENNPNLITLDGLSVLNSIGEDLPSGNPPSSEAPEALIIVNNVTLLHCDGLSSLHSINGGLRIERNTNLVSLNGFQNLLLVRWIEVNDNSKLLEINGFGSLVKIEERPNIPGRLIIRQNNNLSVLHGFSALNTAGDIRILNNDKLFILEGFNSLTKINGYLEISGNGSLSEITGFKDLTVIAGFSRFIPNSGLIISSNASLRSFTGLASLEIVTSEYYVEVSVDNNSKLENIDGLASLTTIYGLYERKLNVVENTALENIDGLSSLIHMDDGPGPLYINVKQNPALTSCCGLQPLFGVYNGLNVFESLVANGNINVSGNGAGCTPYDILTCGSQRISGFTVMNQGTHEVIQSFQDEMTINVADPRFSNLMLQANAAPQQVGSVEFIFDENIRRIENGFPYQFILPALTPGTHTVRVEVYSKGQKQGVKGVGRTATFKVINSAIVISIDVYDLSHQHLMKLQDGDEINIKDPAFKTFLLSAYTVPTIVSKVEFFLNNRRVAVENGFPYELLVNRPPGDYTLEAIPYIRIRDNYYPGTSMKINFKLVSEDPGASGQFVINDESNNENLLKVGESAGVTIFPVPVDHELYIKIDDTAGKDPMITIRTIHGLTVYQESYSKSQSINTLHLPAGVYYLQVAGQGGFQKVIRFIKK